MPDAVATIIIPNYDGMPYLPALLSSLAAQSERRFETVVVDDRSPDESCEYLRRAWPQVRLIRNERNLGFAGSCNAGLRSAATEYVALLNNDTHVDREWLREGLRPFERAEVGSVASLVLLAAPPHLIDSAGDVFSVAGGAVKRGHPQPADHAAELSQRCLSACGASAFYRRACLERVGYLDEAFESYYEDVELGLRLAWAGYECAFAARSICYHHLSSSYNPRGWRYHFNSARNAEIVWQAHLPKSLRRKFAMAHLAFVALQAANKYRQGCLRPYVAGKLAAARMRDQILAKRKAIESYARINADQLEERLVRDWWTLHVADRRRSARGSAGRS